MDKQPLKMLHTSRERESNVVGIDVMKLKKPKKSLTNFFDFFDISEMLIDQIMLLEQGLSIVLRYLRMNSGITMAVHHLIVFYTTKKRSLQKNSRMYGLNVAACDLMRKLAYSLQVLNSSDYDLHSVTQALMLLYNKVSSQL